MHLAKRAVDGEAGLVDFPDGVPVLSARPDLSHIDDTVGVDVNC